MWYIMVCRGHTSEGRGPGVVIENLNNGYFSAISPAVCVAVAAGRAAQTSAHLCWTLVGLWRWALVCSPSGSRSGFRFGSAEAEPEGKHAHVNSAAAWTSWLRRLVVTCCSAFKEAQNQPGRITEPGATPGKVLRVHLPACCAASDESSLRFS